jgi:hypothetical protein
MLLKKLANRLHIEKELLQACFKYLKIDYVTTSGAFSQATLNGRAQTLVIIF